MKIVSLLRLTAIFFGVTIVRHALNAAPSDFIQQVSWIQTSLERPLSGGFLEVDKIGDRVEYTGFSRPPPFEKLMTTRIRIYLDFRKDDALAFIKALVGAKWTKIERVDVFARTFIKINFPDGKNGLSFYIDETRSQLLWNADWYELPSVSFEGYRQIIKNALKDDFFPEERRQEKGPVGQKGGRSQLLTK